MSEIAVAAPKNVRVSDTVISKVSRIQSIDLLRGVVMILMALDHVRDYFHAPAYFYNPLDLTQTSAPIFLTRWVTHFCAPVFVFLAGTSAFLVGERKGKKELSKFLLTRGLWLLVLEFTIINFSWFFNIQFTFFALTVIWALGVGMIILSAMVHLSYRTILTAGIVIIFGHNLLDSVHFTEENAAFIWSFIHDVRFTQIGNVLIGAVYSIPAWTGIMLAGYGFGKLYLPSVDPGYRRKFLLGLGSLSIILFVIIRMTNVYGDPSLWSTQPTAVKTVLSFINASKYPPSLLYVLMTLGPAFIFLAVTEKVQGKIAEWTIALGRVPMFYYIIHIYLIHVLAVFAALATGFDASAMVFGTWVTDAPSLKGYGFNLIVVYVAWFAVVAVLLPLCLKYDRYKTANRDKWWLSYL